MRTITIPAVTLGIALAALFLVGWPIVGDAPWEEEVVVVQPVDRTVEIRCHAALDLREILVQEGFRRTGQTQLANDREIDRYC